MLKLTMPVRRDRASYRRMLGEFVSGPGPFLSFYLDVRPGEARDGARQRLLDHLDQLVRRGDPPLSAEQWSAAGDALGLIEEDDATLVVFVDAAGDTLTTGFPFAPSPERFDLTARPVVGPMLAAEQRLVHHVVALVDDGRLTLRTTPRHGPASHIELEIDDPSAIPAVIQRTARVSRTALVVLCAPGAELPGLSSAVRTSLPVSVGLDTVATDGLTDEGLEAEINARQGAHAHRQSDEVASLWTFHHVHDEAVDGLDAATRAVVDGRAGLLLISDRVVLADAEGSMDTAATPAVEALIWHLLADDRPIHLMGGDGPALRDGVGVILDRRVDPEQLADLLER